MKNENITAWVTKCALTSGIRKVSGTVRHETSSDMLSYIGSRYDWREYVHGNDWHRTPEAALARAEEMRKNKIAALKKRIAKLKYTMFMIEE
jgi:hypothetical protein